MRWLLSFLLVITVIAAPSKGESLRTIFRAIGQVESGNNDKVKDGDNGKSIGRYQIQYAYWKDSGVSGHYQECRKKDYAEKVMIGYWKRYCSDALRKGDAEVLARIHNGGPRGHKIKATLPYWKKVKKHLK